MQKTIPRKSVTDVVDGSFNEGKSRQVDHSITEGDSLDKPLPKGNMLGSSKQPINSGTRDTHYNGGHPSIPRSSEMGSNT